MSAADLADKVHVLQPLTAFERRVLTHLTERPDQLVSYEEAKAAMYGTQVHGHVTSNVLQVVVSRIRSKLVDSKQPWTVEAVRGKGYRLVAKAAEGGEP